VSSDRLLTIARQAVEDACEAVFELAKPDGTHPGASATLTVLLLDGPHAAMAHVGDSRLYLQRQGRIEQLTTDHTVTQELLRAGQISEDEARKHPWRHVLSRSLGPQPSVVIDTLSLDAAAGDVFLLSSRRSQVTVVRVTVERPAPSVRSQAVDLLRHVSLFAGLNLAGRSRVVGAGTIVHFDPGVPFADELDGLWIVLTGRLAWPGPPKQERTRGQCLGEAALVTPMKAPEGIEVTERTTLLHIPSRSFARLAKRRPLLGLAVMERLAATLAVPD
jgi:CRP-like cAMP-binding protein